MAKQKLGKGKEPAEGKGYVYVGENHDRIRNHAAELGGMQFVRFVDYLLYLYEHTPAEERMRHFSVWGKSHAKSD